MWRSSASSRPSDTRAGRGRRSRPRPPKRPIGRRNRLSLSSVSAMRSARDRTGGCGASSGMPECYDGARRGDVTDANGPAQHGPARPMTRSPRALQPRSRRRPVDQPEPARSVSWLDSAGFPANGRGPVAPAREGRLSSQSPRGSRAVSARTTSFLPYPHGAAEPRGRQPTRSRTPGIGPKRQETNGCGCQPRNRYPAPRIVSTTSRRSFLRR